MRMLAGVLLFSTFVNIGFGEGSSSESSKSDATVRIQKLVLIEAAPLPDGDRDQITRLFEHRMCREGEMRDRIRIAFQNLGYFKVEVDAPKISVVGETGEVKDVDVTVRVDEGAQYRLGEIRFENASVFPPDRMRSVFAMQRGDLCKLTGLAEGLAQLRELYGTEGYVDYVAIPETRIHDSDRTIDLTIEIDEGKPYDFGRLVLDGTEPYAGAGRALLASWKTLEGKRYNWVLLGRWLRANTSRWPSAPTLDKIATAEDPELRVINVKVVLP